MSIFFAHIVRVHSFFSIPLKELLLLQQGVMGGEKKAFGTMVIAVYMTSRLGMKPLQQKLSLETPSAVSATACGVRVQHSLLLHPFTHLSFRPCCWGFFVSCPLATSNTGFGSHLQHIQVNLSRKYLYSSIPNCEPLFLEMCTVSFLSQP